MHDLVTFGEAMVRLSPPNFRRLEQATTMEVCAGGAELNVAVAASRLGLKTAWVSRLPQNALGRLTANAARLHGVDVSHVVWAKDGRMGLYFLEFGANPRASSVLYDRAGSSISLIKPGEVKWAEVFQGARHFHTSGITPALSASAAETTAEALRAAKAAGLSVSYDLNYRSKLWSPHDARRVQEPLMEMVDILLTTEEDTKIVFGITADAGTVEKTYAEVAVKLADRFKFKAVAITLRKDLSVWRNNWTAIVYAGGRHYTDREYELELVDRIGAGDSFTAGFLVGWLGGDIQLGLRMGNALAALKHSIPGDLNYATREEVENLLKGAGTRVQR